MEKNFNLAYELRKCKECSCSRCNLAGTRHCYVEVAIKELGRYEQAMDSLVSPGVPRKDVVLRPPMKTLIP